MLDSTYSDIELIELARCGHEFAEEEIAGRYSKTVRMCARPFFLAGGDSEDLIQEGMLGLISAIRKYDSTNGASFKTFAEQCIRNRILSAVAAASRQKHSPLNDGVSLDDAESLHKSMIDTFIRQTEDFVLEKEIHNDLTSKYDNNLSEFEKTIITLYLSGLSYREIANRTGKCVKSVDNAVQRIRKKIAQMN